MKKLTTKDRHINYIRALVHGDSGIGKTTSLATLPESSTLIIALERGLLPLRQKNYQVLAMETWADMRDLGRMLSTAENTDKGLTLTLDGEVQATGVKTIAIDSLSECNNLCMKQIIEIDRKKLTETRTKGKTDTVAGIYEEQMTMEDWGILGTRMASFVSAINHAPCHTIFTSLSSWKEDKRTGQQFRTPALSGALSTSISAYFDLVLSMEVLKVDGQDMRAWRTQPDGIHICKDASGCLEEFEETNWTTIFKKIINGKGE